MSAITDNAHSALEPSPLTPDEYATFNRHRFAMMRRRIAWIGWALIALSPAIMLLIWLYEPTVVNADGDPREHIRAVRIVGSVFLLIAVSVWIFITWLMRSGLGSSRIVRLSGVITLITAMLAPILAVAPLASESPSALSLMVTWSILAAIVILTYLPWTIAEGGFAAGSACVVFLLLTAPSMFEKNASGMDALDMIMSVIALNTLGFGASAVAASSRRAAFASQRMAERVARVSRELEIARQVHDAVFPKPTDTGGWHFDFRYEPMQQIGGDYAFLRQTGRGTIAGLIDITGHGIAAALTVNRLHGEIDRFLGDHPDATPDELLIALNRYLHHTLSDMAIFGTAVCIRTTGTPGELQYANAGHPPVMIRRADHPPAHITNRPPVPVDSFDATGPVLGVVSPEHFEIERRVIMLHVGDNLLAYTDGIIEAKGSTGQLWINGLREMLQRSQSPRMCDEIIAAVQAFRKGPAQDDVLVMEIKRVG